MFILLFCIYCCLRVFLICHSYLVCLLFGYVCFRAFGFSLYLALFVFCTLTLLLDGCLQVCVYWLFAVGYFACVCAICVSWCGDGCFACFVVFCVLLLYVCFCLAYCLLLLLIVL